MHKEIEIINAHSACIAGQVNRKDISRSCLFTLKREDYCAIDITVEAISYHVYHQNHNQTEENGPITQG